MTCLRKKVTVYFRIIASSNDQPEIFSCTISQKGCNYLEWLDFNVALALIQKNDFSQYPVLNTGK